jgi:trk system potassium uptake protein TrkH
MNCVLAAASLAAVAALVLEYGFRVRPVPLAVLRVVESAAVAVFVADRLLRLALSADRRAYLKHNWVDFALIAAAAAVLGVGFRLWGNVLSAGALYVIITQAYILVSLVIRGVNLNLRFADSGIHPTWMLVGSFALLCLVGSGLLMLPVAVHPGTQRWYYDDALFTAVSATCVTGLVVKNTGTHFTLFGQGVILVLIQLGGLGIMMFGTFLAVLVGRGLSVRTSTSIGQMLATERVGELARTLKFVALVTLLFEAAGAAMFYPMFASALDARGQAMSAGMAAWHSVFHSVSSFCNAGFALYGRNMMQGVAEGWASPLRSHWQIMGVMAPLIVLGGLGFPVLQDCARWLASRARWTWRRARAGIQAAAPRARLSLHSKIVLATSAALLVVGAAGLILIEKLPSESAAVGENPLKPDQPLPRRADPTALEDLGTAALLKEAAFQSVTARTAGFSTVDMDRLSSAGKLWLCVLMMVGGSPASTAGGMKTATFALLVVATFCLLRRRNELEVFRRSISMDLLRKTVALALMYVGLVVVVTLLLAVSMKKQPLINLLFEACSACGTVGLTTGITPALPPFPKYVVTAGMFIGRLGPLTLLLALTSRMKYVRYTYPTESVVIG